MRVPGLAATFITRFGLKHGLRKPPPRASLLSADWAELAALFHWLDAGVPRFPSVFAHHFLTGFPIASWVASHVASPAALHRAAVFAWKRLWTVVTFEVEELKGGLVLICTLDPAAVPCEPFFKLAAEVLRQMPGLIGVAPSEVIAQIGPRRGKYLITFASHRVDGGRAEHTPEVIFANLAQLGDSLSPRQIPPSWRLSEAEARVVTSLLDGINLRQAATRLDIEYETARTQLKRAMAKAQVKRQAELVAAVLNFRL